MTTSSSLPRASWLRRLGIQRRRSSPIKALLLDLDDTLLINDWDTFSSHYYALLTEHVAHLCSRDTFMSALYAGTRAMVANDGGRGSNKDVFMQRFLPHFPNHGPEIVRALDVFYEQVFDALRQWTHKDPSAPLLVETALRQGLQVAIATQPVFPLSAIQARLRWAGVGVEDHDYAYVACYEAMSACKPHAQYFDTICEQIGREPSECLMVGDSIDADMPAAQYGLRTFWVMRHPPTDGSRVQCDARGMLPDLVALIETGDIHAI